MKIRLTYLFFAVKLSYITVSPTLMKVRTFAKRKDLSMRDLIVSLTLALALALVVGITGQSIGQQSECGNSVTKLITDVGGNPAALNIVTPNRVEYIDVQARVTIPSVPPGMLVDRSASALPPVSTGGRVHDAGIITITCNENPKQ